ncbi:rod shape-determining protein [Tepidibacter aestuarii]|uniref:rod shape-determining protein n=1 Tax=Tepidibacter aestuarii TaxID=2925782 RepID=UPI00273A7118|nr:rod shape-determining protein [Tepidibacter aestuarii]CAH2214382.1 cell-shape determining protein [Tepidibacter aestuarii]
MRFFMTSKDIGIDLGTTNTFLYVKGQGILLREPSVVTVNTRNRQVLTAGLDAKNMTGRTPEGIETIQPLKGGVIANFDLTEQMLKKFIDKVNGKGVFKSSRIAISHPSGITEVEKRAINEVIRQVGARKVMLIEESVAAAIGSGLPVNEPVGNMIINIGGGTIEVAVISLQGIVISKTLKVAGDELDKAIIGYVKKEFNLIIGERTAEKVKIELGSVYVEDDERNMEIRGRDLVTGLPRAVTITESQIREALKEPVISVIEAIKAVIEQTPPELAADIMDKGIMLSGGGALLKGLNKLIYSEIHIPAYIAEDPLDCAVLGAGRCLDMMDKI